MCIGPEDASTVYYLASPGVAPGSFYALQHMTTVITCDLVGWLLESFSRLIS